MSTQKVLLCPTLDIDLIFHTHMLSRRYTGDVVHSVGRHVDHNDKIEEGVLSKAFEDTSKRWERRFNQKYTTCGCLISNLESDKGKKAFLSKVFSKARSSSERSSQHSEQEAFDDSTHPSAHNSVAISGTKWNENRKARKIQTEEQIQNGSRRVDHRDPFLDGYSHAILYPFVYIPAFAYVEGTEQGAGRCVSGESRVEKVRI